MRKEVEMYSKLFSLFIGIFMLVVFLGCSSDEKIVNLQSSGTFLQEFNPEYVDVLWVIDDRSPITSPQYIVRQNVIDQASAFFTRLEGVRKSYRMAFVSADMEFAKGTLKPKGSPVILERHIGDTNTYVTLFKSIINQVIINLSTGAEPKGFESAETALSQNFKPRAGIPLVIIFISDSEDVSASKTPGQSVVDYYTKSFLSLKENNAKLLRVYSINYTATGARCSGNVHDADIDKPSYEGRAFALAGKLGGETADICGAFSGTISLEGLRLKETPKRFTLERKAKPESISVNIVLKTGESVQIAFHFEAATNEVVFETTPPEGSTIQVSYLPI